MRIELLNASDDKYYWRIVAENGEVLAHSETYERKSDAAKTAKSVISDAASANFVDCT